MSTTTFKPGDRVVVVQYPTTSNVEPRFLGLAGTFVRLSKPHGFAVVRLMDNTEYYFHPEDLQPETDR